MSPDKRGPRTTKRGDQVAELIKGWINDGRVRPGKRLNKEAELQQMFNVSRGSMRDALKALEVQGLVSLSTGPEGAPQLRVCRLRGRSKHCRTICSSRTSRSRLYAVRRTLEPIVAAGAVAHLTDADFEALERSISVCEPFVVGHEQALDQRCEDIHFHDVLAAAHPNAFYGASARSLIRCCTRW